MVDWFIIGVGICSIGFTLILGIIAWVVLANNQQLKEIHQDLLSVAKRIDAAVPFRPEMVGNITTTTEYIEEKREGD